MKNKKSLLAIIVLLIVVGACVSTYAIYKSSASGTATATAAAWVVNVNNSNIVTSDTYTFSAADIVWDNSTSNAASGTIAPGSTGTITILIDADGTQVPVDYTVALGQVTYGSTTPYTNVSNDAGFTVALKSGSPALTGTIAYSATEGEMEKIIQLQVTWTGTASDSDDKNAADVNLAAQNLQIPVTVTAAQHIGA